MLKKLFCPIAVLAFSLLPFGLTAQDEHDVVDKHEGRMSADHHYKNIVAIYTGTTLAPTLLGDEDKQREYLFVPTYGLELARKVQPWLGFGVHNEFELQNYVIVKDDGEELDRSYVYVGSVLIIFIPIKHLGIFIGPGVELSSEHNFRVFKFGMEYVLFRGDGHGWYIAPEFSVDWISSLYSTVTFGVAFGKGF